MAKPKTWTVEVELGSTWLPLCLCFYETEAARLVEYFRPMAAFSGRVVRARAN